MCGVRTLIQTLGNPQYQAGRVMSEALPLPEPLGGDRDRGSAIIIPQTVLLAIATCLVIARLITRGLITRSLGLDDLFIVLGNVSTIN